ncbi:bactofilin family protein [Pseudodesulfovibrio sp.]|uniref:bactofilin family protein n=1 Tax=unclassified Pseudodesulfovibrio TaxID=2661612 RepID=UPI003AFF8DF8
MFSKKENNDSELNAFLGVGTEYKGKLDFVGTVRIDGRFEGEISTEGDLILGRQAIVTGTIQVGRLTSCGRIEGDVTVKERTVLEKTSVLKGSLSTPVLAMEQGAVLDGGITMAQGAEIARLKVLSADFSGRGQKDENTPLQVAKTGSEDSL